jgi:hypothetical protein
MKFRLSPALLGGIFLIVLYAGFYLGEPLEPGNNLNPCCAAGWITWADQGRYYRSAFALADGNLDPRLHWYPLGYALVAAPFNFLRSNIFFVVDLLGLLGAYAGFVLFARRVGIAAVTAVILFLLCVCTDAFLFRQWAIPWSTTPSAGLIWGMLAVAAAYLQGQRHPFLLGLLAGALPLFRPADALLGAICLFWVGADAVLRRQLSWRDAGLAILGALVLILPYAALHLRIYGPHATAYMADSRNVGFTLHNLAWRAYVLLIEPRQWFFAGQGIIERIPWLLLGFAGSLYALRGRGLDALLSACLTAYCLLFLAYVDLLPTGVWHYSNIHYFKWTLPGFGLLGWLLVRDLYARRRLAWGALAVLFLLSCVRVTPRLVGPAEPAVAVDIPGAAATEKNSTMNPGLTAIDDDGLLPSPNVIRAFPFPLTPGARLIGLRRDLVGTVDWVPHYGIPMPDDPPPQKRWGEHIRLGYPCWLPPLPCKKPTGER